MKQLLGGITAAVIDGDRSAIAALTTRALDGGVRAGDILAEALMPAMDQVGTRFRDGEVFLPELLLSGRVMQECLDILKPLLAPTDMGAKGTIVIGTVQGDLHEIGKNLVALMAEGAGFEVHDLGRDVRPASFVEAVTRVRADVVAMSALLTTTMPAMSQTINALKAAGLRDQVKVVVGGAPVSRAFAEQIGADGYAPDAQSATDLMRSLVSAGQPLAG